MKPIPLQVRFQSRIDKSAGPEGCWIWVGTKTKAGYGKISLGLRTGKDIYAHRLAWKYVNGSIPEGLFVCHHCDNPCCVNPKHLFLGTPSDNMKDCARKGRNLAQAHPERLARGEKNGKYTHPESRLRGEKNGFSKLTEKDVHYIRDNAITLSQRQLARHCSISQAAVWNVIHRRAWQHVE